MATEYSALDRAELELNRVLEQIGRIFAASKTGDRSSVLANATKLKQILPASTNNYHNALDELDQQLQLAKSVMRRDLALLTKGTSDLEESVAPPEISTAETITETAPVTSVDATEQRTDGTSANEVGSTSDHDANAPDTLANDTEMTEAPVTEALKVETNHIQAAAPPPNESEAADKAPDTAFTTNADMDSLFNDPLTAGTDGNEDAIDFGDAGNDETTFNFDSFDNANTSEGLPPLTLDMQGFAEGNNSTQDEPDFSALFGDVAGQADETGNSPADEQDIFNFDELMDMGIDPNAGTSEPEGTQEAAVQ